MRTWNIHVYFSVERNQPQLSKQTPLCLGVLNEQPPWRDGMCLVLLCVKNQDLIATQDNTNHAKLLLIMGLHNACERTPGLVPAMLKTREQLIKSRLHEQICKGLVQSTVSVSLWELELYTGYIIQSVQWPL